MLGWALTFLVIGVIAAVLGFTTIAGASFAIAKFLAAVFLILFLVFVILRDELSGESRADLTRAALVVSARGRFASSPGVLAVLTASVLPS